MTKAVNGAAAVARHASPRSNVEYITASRELPQVDAEWELTHTDPWWSLANDFRVLLANVGYVPLVLGPPRFARPLPGVTYPWPRLIFDYVMTGVLTAVQLLALPVILVASLVLPGLLGLLFAALVLFPLFALAGVMWNSATLVESQIDIPDVHGKERWVFVNGIGTSYSMLQTTCDQLSATFQRRIVGVHNRSYGVLLDVLQCFLQRSFDYNFADTTVLYIKLRQILENDDIEKLVVIAHSQGGMTTSLALDRLYEVLPADCFRKMELYTFGSAASHLHNPYRGPSKSSPPGTAQQSSAEPDRYIPIIEHYVNDSDIVPRWGVLYHIKRRPAYSYAGCVFAHQGQTGHLFDPHYLEAMFPAGAAADVDDPRLFLNHGVFVEPATQVKRAKTLPLDKDGLREGRGGTALVNGTKIQAVQAVPVQTVRELSRLWRYMDGNSP